MNRPIYGFLLCFTFFLMPINLRAMPQQTIKLIPIEDWIAFKCRTNDAKPLKNFFGKLLATYDSVFHKPDNTTNIEKNLSDDALEKVVTNGSEELIKSNLSMTNKMVERIENEKQINNLNDMNIELLSNYNNNIPTTKPSSISRISKDNEWLDDIEEAEPLSELEIVDDEVDRSVENVPQQSGFPLSIAFVRAFGKWLGSIFGFTRGAYVKFIHTSI